MTVESATYISQLAPANPGSADPKSEGDDHLRLIKTVLQAQFPNVGAAAVTATAAELNQLTTLSAPVGLTETQTLSNKSFSGDTNGLGIAISRSKPAATARSSTTTPTNDPDLTCALTVAVATWAVDLWLPIWGTGSGAAGIKLDMTFTGTTPASLYAVTGVVNGALAAAYQAQTGAVVFSAAALTNAASTPDWVRLSGTLATTTAGTLSLQWSQNSSSASAINIGQGAWMNVTRVG